LKSTDIPSTVPVIGDNACASCIKLTKVDLREGLEGIGEGEFSHCASLHRVVIPPVSDFGGGAFASCPKLFKVELCEGLVNIGEKAFSSCTSLRHIAIPSTVKSIGKEALADCTNLINVELSNGLVYSPISL
jgi:hypothetical protein